MGTFLKSYQFTSRVPHPFRVICERMEHYHRSLPEPKSARLDAKSLHSSRLT
jgi:hypothetical protein